MNIAKKILLGLAALIALVLLVALFVRRDFAIERQIVINQPKPVVFDYLKTVKNQEHWNTWSMADPNMKRDYRGTDGTPGFVSAWDGNRQVGTGEQEIKSITPGERIDLEIRFLKPLPSVSPVYLATEAVSESQTRVTWGMTGQMHYPFNVLQLFVSMDDMLGPQYEQSLTNLKTILEKEPLTEN